MGKFYELKAEEVRAICPIDILPFEKTDELNPFTGIIGQERAVRSMEFGLRVQREGYNIFIAGPIGTGKATYAQSITKQIAKNEKVPDDWCYVYNFNNPEEPLALSFPVKEGKVFANTMYDLLDNLLMEIPRVFESEEYSRKKNILFNKYQDSKAELLNELDQFAKMRNFILQEKRSGLITVATKDGKPFSQEEYEELSPDEKDRIEYYSQEIQEKAIEVFRRGRELERKFIETLDNIDQETGSLIIDFLINPVLETYKNNHQVLDYLKMYKEDVLDSLEDFRQKEDDSELAVLVEKEEESYFVRFGVNVFVDNTDLKGAPVIYETNPTYYRLLGKVEYTSRMGSLVTSFMQIKPGALHHANGGYLILSAKDLLVNGESWYALKRILKTGKIQIENIGESYGLVAVVSLHPQSIPIKVKVILVGIPYYHQLLLRLDEDYPKLFKIKADFEDSMDRNEENILNIAQFIRAYGEMVESLTFHASGVAEIIDYSSRMAGSQKKLSTHFNQLIEVINEAETWAKLAGDKIVSSRHLKKAIREKEYRNRKYEDLIQSSIQEGKLMIDCTGQRIGQINALVVLDFGDFMFGHPSKVTAVSYRGKRGVIHIERETKMSGAIHDKGLMILTNFLGSRYAQEKALNLSASLTFEQVYGGIDGDSASCAELIALISSIAQVPINQNIAITGSVNQFGEVQPVGGVTQKVEGFFKTCKTFGMTGDQGVVLPKQNIHNLMLDQEVVEAIRNKQFHIYPISTIDEGIEILTGLPTGHLRRDGTYPRNTINFLVKERLNEFVEEEKKS